jgi:hypothetical protein
MVKYRSPIMPLIVMALLFLCNTVYPQIYSENDTIIKISPGTLVHIRDSISFFSNDSLFRLPNNLIPSAFSIKDKNLIFFDSLKIRASKNALTKKIYDFVIVSPEPLNFKRITGSSEASFTGFSGKKIRKIDLKELDVFGTNINNPAASNPSKIDHLLNKTHANTNEKIIRKNLLFKEGDLISPLTLSDNERILRQLPFIHDARIIIVPVSDEEVDIMVVTKDVYSLGGSFDYEGLKKGAVSVFEKNVFGIGHEFGIEVPYDSKFKDSPGFGVHYNVDNIRKSFINLNLYYLNGLGNENYGFSLIRKLISSSTKYAGGISIQHMNTLIDLNKTLPVPQPLRYYLHDYWLLRSFMLNREKVTRLIVGARYTNNNVFERPVIAQESYHYLENYKMYLGSVALSVQKYYKTNLIYGYGRTEDIPYGGLVRITAGRELNELKQRTYLATEFAMGKSNNSLGYFYASAGIGSYFRGVRTEQGLLSFRMNYFSNLVTFGRNRMRNFVYFDYTRGFDRYSNESIQFVNENGFSGFKNDSVKGNQRFSVSVESVLFSPLNLYGFRFAFFGFADFSFLSGTNQILGNGYGLSAIGLGIRIRNDNLVFNTFQFRFGYFPHPPDYSTITRLIVSGEQLLRPYNFDSGPPSIIPYR